MQMFRRQFSRGMLVEDNSLEGTPYILHPRVVLECSHYFLDWTSFQEGDPS